MGKTGAATNDLGFRQISETSVMSGRNSSEPHRSNPLVGQLFWPGNLQHLLVSAVAKMPLLMLQTLYYF